MRFKGALSAVLCALPCVVSPVFAHAQGVTVSVHVTIERPLASAAGKTRSAMSMSSEPNVVVAWLTPLGPTDANSRPAAVPTHGYVLTQKNKQFSPHLLVVPTGSSVEFPNLDPFFHNVFSLFNGRRFDLGLYEAGSRRSVRFDHDGVSYIFCNIHPEMGAVIVSLSTPYYATSGPDQAILIRDVPSGDYALHLWSEDVSPTELAAATQTIRVSAQNIKLPAVVLRKTASPSTRHLDKFGEEYKKPDETPY